MAAEPRADAANVASPNPADVPPTTTWQMRIAVRWLLLGLVGSLICLLLLSEGVNAQGIPTAPTLASPAAGADSLTVFWIQADDALPDGSRLDSRLTRQATGRGDAPLAATRLTPHSWTAGSTREMVWQARSTSSRSVMSLTPGSEGPPSAPAQDNQAPTFPTQTATRGVDENTAAGQPIGDPFAATDPEAGSLSYSLGGDDAGSFSIDSSSGQLRTRSDLDHEAKSQYEVTVIATDSAGLTAEVQVTISVTNVDEPGTVTLFPAQPRVWSAQRATLSDPDGRVRSVTWEWEWSSDQVDWTGLNIVGATYIPGTSREGMYIRARASYRDRQGANKNAAAVTSQVVAASEAAPNITVVDVVTGLKVPWDLAFAPDGTMLFTQRAGVLSARLSDGTVQEVTADLSDLYVSGEAGFMAIVLDPSFATNRRFYTCQNDSESTSQIVAWTIDDEYGSAVRVNDPLVGDIPAANRHSGCRLRFGPNGYLWIATGDGKSGTAPQDLTSLGGKILRVDSSTGAAAPDNPFGTRVYTYGHRNPQGLARRPNTNEMWVVEHGPDIDDEINLLTAGGNYGWNPVPGYNENVPMTDLQEFPDAIEAKWSSGDPTLATSGGIFLHGADWKQWNGRLAVATLKEVSLRIFQFDSTGAFVSQVFVPKLYITYGRLRTPLLGPDGALYITTSRGSADRIIKVVPSLPPVFAEETKELSVLENSNPSTVVGTVSATDPEGQTLTYTLSGSDAEFFSLVSASGGQVRTNASFDREAKDSYEVVVNASDPYGLRDGITLEIAVADVDEPPTIAGQAQVIIEENSSTLVGTYTAADPEGGDSTWLSLQGADARYFRFDELTGQLSFIDTPDYDRETNGNHDETYDVVLRASDEGNRVGRLPVTVMLTNVNEEPLIEGDSAVDIDEVVKPSPGQVVRVGTYTKRDPERSATNWGIVGSTEVLSGLHADAFEFDRPTGRLSFLSPPDFEDGGGRYEVTLNANDGVLDGALDIVVNIANLEEAGSLTLGAQRGVNGTLLEATLVDPDIVATQTWKWQRSPSTSGPWTDVANTNASSYTPGASDVNHYLRAHVSYTDGSGTDQVTLTAATSFATANSSSANESPVPPDPLPQVNDVPENAPAGRNVVRVVFSDPEMERLFYSLDSDEFAVDPDTGQVTVKPGAELDYDTPPRSYSVVVRAADPFGAEGMATLTIGVSNVNERPYAADDAPGSINEDTSVAIDVLANDSDPENDELSVTALTQPSNGSAAVESDGRITYTPRANYHGSDSFTYRARDTGGLASEQAATVVLTIDPENDAPTFVAATVERSVFRGAVEGDSVGAPLTAMDVDANDTLTYRLSGADAFAFEIDADGQITVGAGITLDRDIYNMTVTATDNGTPPQSATVEVTIRASVPSSNPGGGGGGGGGAPPVPVPSDKDFDWNVTRDLEALDRDHDLPTGMWSDGRTLWILDNAASGADRVFAYDLETGERLSEREFELDRRNRFSHGLWSDGETLWVADSGQDWLFAYVLETGVRDQQFGFGLHARNRDPRGIWFDEQRIYVLDSVKDALFVYELKSGELLAEHPLDKLNKSPRGIWSDGVALWVSDDGAKRLFAYEFEDGTLVRREELEFTFRSLLKAGNGNPRGIWSDGDTIWIVDEQDDKVYSYNLPDATIALLQTIELNGAALEQFSPLRLAYSAQAEPGEYTITVSAEATHEGANVSIEPPDADANLQNGHQVEVVDGQTVTITVTSVDGSRSQDYLVALDAPPCIEGLTDQRLSPVTFAGGAVNQLRACARAANIDVLFYWDGRAWLLFAPAGPDFLNRAFEALFASGLPLDTALIATRPAS